MRSHKQNVFFFGMRSHKQFSIEKQQLKMKKSLGDIVGVLNNSMNLLFYMISGSVFRNAFLRALRIWVPTKTGVNETGTTSNFQ